MYTFKATCLKTSQSPGGTHSATLQGSDGSEVTIPSKDLLFEAGVEYSISVDGKFAKSAPAAKPVAPVAVKPVTPVVAKPTVPAPVPVAPKPVAPVVQPMVAPKKP
jgi:hypothetical protein